MRVFVTGASGAIGSYLVPQLIEAGHDVIGVAKSDQGADRIRAMGGKAVVVDLLDPKAVRRAVLEARPDAIIHEATALSGIKFGRNMDKLFTQTNRLRREGTDNLLAAAREAGVSRFVAQSYAPLIYARTGGWIKSEDDPLLMEAPAGMKESLGAMRYLEDTVTKAGGIVLRYGGFYGAPSDAMPEPVRKRQFPIAGSGAGVSSFIHLYDAASATVLALEHDGPAIYNIVDDDPAPLREWLPELANILGARPPRHAPVWMAKLFAGDLGVIIATEARGSSNAKAKRELGWTLRYPSWRQGFVATYVPSKAKAATAPTTSQPRHVSV
jgi:nucleoside-diphosphate-sugar epimerase